MWTIIYAADIYQNNHWTVRTLGNSSRAENNENKRRQFTGGQTPIHFLIS